MYINSVLSFLGAWQKLRKDHQLVLEDIRQALTAIDLKKYLSQDDIKSPYRLTSPRELQRDLRRGFAQLGWNTSVRMPIGRSIRRYREIDFVKEGVGV